MANHESAKKRVRRNQKRAMINRNRRSRMRTFIKNIELAIAEGDYNLAGQALVKAQPEIYRSVAKGLLHKKTAARKMSRLSARIKSLKNVS